MCIAGGICVHLTDEGISGDFAVFIPMVTLSPIGSAFLFECFGRRRHARILYAMIIAGTLAVFFIGSLFILQEASRPVVFGIAYGWLFLMIFSLVLFEAKELRPFRSMPKGLRIFFFLVCLDVALAGGVFFCEILDFDPGLYILWMIFVLSILLSTLSYTATRKPTD